VAIVETPGIDLSQVSPADRREKALEKLENLEVRKSPYPFAYVEDLLKMIGHLKGWKDRSSLNFVLKLRYLESCLEWFRTHDMLNEVMDEKTHKRSYQLKPTRTPREIEMTVLTSYQQGEIQKKSDFRNPVQREKVEALKDIAYRSEVDRIQSGVYTGTNVLARAWHMANHAKKEEVRLKAIQLLGQHYGLWNGNEGGNNATFVFVSPEGKKSADLLEAFQVKKLVEADTRKEEEPSEDAQAEPNDRMEKSSILDQEGVLAPTH